MSGHTETNSFDEIFEKEFRNFKESVENSKWVVYPDVEITIDDLKEYLNARK